MGLARKVRMPKFFGVEGSARIGVFHELIAHAPATVAAFHHIHPARLIATVRIIVAREEISVLIENEILRIAQTKGEHFEVGAVGLAAKDTAGLWLTHRAAIGQLYVGAAVADAEIKFAVGAKVHAVQIVSQKTYSHPKTIMQGLP